MTSRRDRNEHREDPEEQQQEPELTEFQKRCKHVLETEFKFTKIVDGTTFGAHLHCYRQAIIITTVVGAADAQTQPQKHEHGEALVLCLEGSKAENLDSDLRYLSVASRIANTTKKKCLVAFESKQTKEVRIIELVSIT